MSTPEQVKVTLAAIKSESSWRDSGQNLTKYLQIGDRVDHGLEIYFLEVLLPAHFDSTLIQMGEPHDHTPEGYPRFLTIQKHWTGAWVYTGIRRARERVSLV